MKKEYLAYFLLVLFSPASYSIELYPQAIEAYENTPVVIDVLHNASGALPSTLSISQQPRAGTYSQRVFTPYPTSHQGNIGYQIEVVDGKVVFQPAPDYSESYSFDFQAEDAEGNSDQSFYLVHVQPVNQRAEVTVPLEEHLFNANFSRNWVPLVNDPDNSEIISVSGSHQNAGVIRDISLNTYYDPHNLTLVANARGIEKTFSLVTTQGDTAPNIATTLINVYGGRISDTAISQTIPAISLPSQEQTFKYYLSQNNPFVESNYNGQLTIELEGDFSLDELPETCDMTNAVNFTGKILTCEVTVPHDTSLQIDVPLTTGAKGIIISRASLPIANDEIRHFDNISEQSLPVVDQIVSPSGNVQTSFIPGPALLLDINNDNLDDLLVAPASFGKPRWYLNNGNGGFTASNFLFAPIDAQVIVKGDLDGDSNPDVVLLGRYGEFQQYEQQGTRLVLQTAKHQWSRNQAHVTSAIIVDLNNNPNGELYVTGDAFYARYKNNDGLLKTPANDDWFGSNISGVSLATGQLNNTLFNELIADNLSGNIQLFNNPGNGNANSLDISDLLSNENSFFQTLLIDDVDKNSFDDVILIARSEKNTQDQDFHIIDLLIERKNIERNSNIKLLKNNDSSLTLQDSLLIPDVHNALAVDMDNDQDNELLIHTSNGAVLLLKNHRGTYQNPNLGLVSLTSSQLLVGRLTNDLTPDILILQTDGMIKTALITEPLIAPTPLTTEESLAASSGGGSISRVAIFLTFLTSLLIIIRLRTKKSPN
ncbi:FG-GAP repeat domain-containing protein [Pelagibaculum spongiae]|nr:VCBS repeat-containing protein [Pelagibaculum spongiae]